MITGTTLNELAAEAHGNAVEHGFYDGVETMDDEALELLHARLFALMHCELSEAIAEDRRGLPIYYRLCKACDDGPCIVDDATAVRCDFTPKGKPPEGCAVELADFVIRLLDWCGWQGVRLGDTVDWVTHYKHLPRLVNALHDMLCGFMEKIDLTTRAIGTNDEPMMRALAAAMISLTEAWFIDRGLSLVDVMREKMAWNAGRPRLHGKMY